MANILITVIKVLIVLWVTITVHEFGHFIFAKIFKVKVYEFSIGFGPKIFCKKFKETVYTFRLIPTGGYCSLNEKEGEDSLNDKNIIQKILIFIMGPIFNIILAFIIFMMLSFFNGSSSSTIYKLSETSILPKYGIGIGDTITRINEEKITTFSDIKSYVVTEKDLDFVDVFFERDEVERKATIYDAVEETVYIGDLTSTLNDSGRYVIFQPSTLASKSGLKTGDVIVSINGKNVISKEDFYKENIEIKDEKIEVVIERNGELISKTVDAEFRYNFDLGISEVEVIKYDTRNAIVSAYNTICTLFNAYISFFLGNFDINGISSVVGIGTILSLSNSISYLLILIASIGFSVGFVNLIPFPPLDGFRIVVEIVQTVIKKKVPDKVINFISVAGFFILIYLMLFALSNDISDLVR